MPLRKNSGTPLLAQNNAVNMASVSANSVLNKMISNCPRVQQLGKNWCWAACAEMVFMNRGISSANMQCTLAATEHGQPAGSCCVNPVPSRCDLGAWPDGTYSRAGLPFHKLNNSIPFANIQAEINNNDPVEVYYQWNSGGAHVAVISGYYTDAGLMEVHVNDPWFLVGRILFSEVQSAYSWGSWSITYRF